MQCRQHQYYIDITSPIWAAFDVSSILFLTHSHNDVLITFREQCHMITKSLTSQP